MMNKIGKKLGYKEGGFTIIEVMIVLAVAGLIMAIVLVAIPQLQRSQRNQSRRDVLTRISAEVNNYIGNNEGVLPTDATTAATNSFTGGFKTRYIDSAPIGTFNAPGGIAYTYSVYPATTPTSIPQDTIMYNAGGTCQGELPTGTGNNRNFAIAVGLEGGASFCVDNQ